MSEQPQPLSMTAQFDQMGAFLENFATAIAQYRRTLEREGVPPWEAAVLTRDYHWLQLMKANWPNDPPCGGPN